MTRNHRSAPEARGQGGTARIDPDDAIDLRVVRDLLRNEDRPLSMEQRSRAQRLLDRLRRRGVKPQAVKALQDRLDRCPVETVEEAEVEAGGSDGDAAIIPEPPPPLKFARTYQASRDLQRSLFLLLADLRVNPEGVPALVQGPPGTGKSMLIRTLAALLQSPVISLSPGQFSSFVHAGPRVIRAVFEQAAALQKRSGGFVIIEIDEAEALLSSRQGLDANQASYAEIRAELLRVTAALPRGVLAISCTNCPEKIDEALLRSGRFGDHSIIVEPPEPEVLERIMAQEFRVRNKLDAETAASIASTLASDAPDGMTGADCVAVAKAARNLANLRAFEREPIVARDLLAFQRMADEALQHMEAPAMGDFLRAMDDLLARRQTPPASHLVPGRFPSPYPNGDHKT